MKTMNSKVTFRIKKQTVRNNKYFVYHQKEYPVDFDLLVNSCNYFYDNQNEYQFVQNIELVNEKEEYINLSEESIQAFIQSCQNEECTISESSVISLQYLAHKFGFTELIQITDQFINEHPKDLIFHKLLFQNFDNSENLNENTFFDTSKEEIFISKHLNDYIQKDEMLSLSIPLLYRILKRYINDESKNDQNLKISEVTDFLFKCLDNYGNSASVLFNLIDFNHEKIDVVDRLVRNYSDVFDFNMINLTLTKTVKELTSEVTKQKEEYSMLFSQMKDTFNQQLSELVKMREEVKEQKKKDDIENKKRIQSFISNIENIKDGVDKKMKSLENRFEKICKKQNEFIENGVLKNYHQMILNAITIGQFNQFDDQLKDHFILEFFKNYWAKLSQEEINRKKSALKSVVDSLSGNENIQVFKVFTNNDDVILKIYNDKVEKLYRQNLLYSRLVDCMACFDAFQVEVKYSCQQFQQIMNLLVGINNKNKKKMKISIILNEKENFEKCKIKSICKVGRKQKIISGKLFCFEGDTDINYLEIHSSNIEQNDDDDLMRVNIFENCTSINELFIASSISEIGNRAFYGCSSIKQVSFDHPSTLKQIGDYSFSGCSSLTSITIPSSVTSIGNYTFQNCTSLASFKIPSSIKSIGNYSFSGCSSLTSITIPSSVTSIGDYSFQNCTSLTSFEIPSSVTSIGNYSFSGCSSLTSITFPSSVKKVGEFCFDSCSKLDSVTIDPSQTQIEYTSFHNCQSLNHLSLSTTAGNEKSEKKQSVLISSGMTDIFYKLNIFSSSEFTNLVNNFTEIQIEIQYPSPTFALNYQNIINLKKKNSNKIKMKIFYTGMEIANNYFNKNTDIDYLMFSSKIKEIPNSNGKSDDGPFAKCTSLIEVFIPSSVTKIGDYSFYGCSSLKKITFELPSSLKQIGYSAFSSCSSLTQISIPSSVTSIENCAFQSCSSLAQVSIPSSVTSIGQAAFYSCSSLKQISIPSSVTSIGQSAFYSCKSLTQVSIQSSVTSIEHLTFNYCSSLTQISIPSSVISIGQSAFSSCSSLTQISIPSSVTSIGESAFSSCSSLTQISIPYSVISIGRYAFSSCSSLKQISIPSSVTSIGEKAFSSCSSLTQISISSSVISIGQDAFYYCKSLKRISVPSSIDVSNIGISSDVSVTRIRP